jgi:hypothetical protein
MRILAGWGIASWVLASGQPIELRDVARDLRLARDVGGGVVGNAAGVAARVVGHHRVAVGQELG